MNWKTGLFIAGGVTAVGYGGYKLTQLIDLKNRVVITPSFRIHNISILTTEIVFAADVTITNPTKGSVTVTHPVISLFDSEASAKKNTPLVISPPSPKTYKLEKQGITKLEPIYLPVKAGSILDIGKQIIAGQPFSLFVQKATRINNLFNQIETEPYTFFKDKEQLKGIQGYDDYQIKTRCFNGIGCFSDLPRNLLAEDRILAGLNRSLLV